MKKRLSLIARILMAVVGVVFIVYSVDWVDKVELRRDAVLHVDAGQDLKIDKQAVLLRVVQGDVDPRKQKDRLLLDLAPLGMAGKTAAVDQDQFADSEHYILRPSLTTTLRHANSWLLLLGLVIIAPLYPIQGYRWLILMRCRRMDVSFGKSMKLMLVGCFCNFFMFGSTGGDLIKAYYAAARSERRTDAVMSVIFDRVAGLIGLILFGGLASLFILYEPVARYIAIWIWSGVVLVILGSAVYFSRRLRRGLGLDWILSKLPMQGIISKVDNAAMAYRDHKKTVVIATLISIPGHLLIAASTAIAGHAVGIPFDRFGLLVTVVPVIFLSGALPTPPQGAGVWELLGRAMLLSPPVVTMNQIVVMLFMTRLYQLAYSLIGAIFLLRGDVHLHPEREETPGGESPQGAA